MPRKLLKTLGGLTAAALAAFLIVGCKGSDGTAGANGTSGTNGTNGSNGSNGTSGTSSPVGINVASYSTDQWANLTVKAAITQVTAGAATTVKFKVTDTNGTNIYGLSAFTSKASTAAFAGYPNLSFTIAKLVPGTGGSPSRWVNYIVTGNPTAAAPTTWTPGKPSTDNIGTLTETVNSDLSTTYTYTFRRDITQTVAQLNAFTYTGSNVKADLDDVSWEPTKTHRLVLQVGGMARGTGDTTLGDRSTNTPDGSNSGKAGVYLKTPANVFYDFIPSTGLAITSTDERRDIVNIAACFTCHVNFNAIHGGARQDTKFCVTCHTDQRKYGTAEATTVAGGYSGTTSKINNHAVGDFTPFIHRMHRGEELAKTGYNYANVLFNEITYPQDQRNCRKCHSASTATPQGDNWFNKPSRLACGACHDNVDFATGTGHGPANLAQSNDSACATTCHTAANIQTSHLAPILTANNPTTPTGLANFTYAIGSATLNGSRQAVIKFQIKKDGTPVTFNAYSSTGVPLTGFTSGPSIYVTYAVPQDGITAPADFNVRSNVSLTNLWNSTQGTLVAGTGADAGWYIATLTGALPTSPIALPANAGMATASIIGSFTQTGLDTAVYPGGTLARPTMLAKAVLTGFTGRRAVVETARCNYCHDQLGTAPNFHSGARNDPQACAFCHLPNATGNGWTYNQSTFVHGIHAKGFRTAAYTWAAGSAAGWEGTYPSPLNQCEQCHLPNTYNFGTTSAAVPNLLWSTVATGTPTSSGSNAYRNSPYITVGFAYGSGFSFAPATGATTPAAGTTLVNSPLSAACFSCHDSATASAHMKANGGSLYVPRSTVNIANSTESCLVCHGAGKVADVKTVHGN